jgi:predicted MFS family arabinose efflux permease
MSAGAANELTPAEKTRAGADGILATWRETPRQAKALLLGVFVNKLAGFIQIFLVLFITHRGFSASQAGLALGMYGAGAVIGTFVGGSLSDRLNPRNATLISMVGSAVLIVAILYLDVYPLLLLAVLLVSTV